MIIQGLPEEGVQEESQEEEIMYTRIAGRCRRVIRRRDYKRNPGRCFKRVQEKR